MFKKEYVFYGTHANRVKSLVSSFSDTQNLSLFRRNVDVLLFAPIVGFLYGRTAVIDDIGGGTTKIFMDQMVREDLEIRFNYQVISLLDNQTENGKRIDSAFRYFDKEEAENETRRFNEYVLGGVDVLFEKLIESSIKDDDYITGLYDFLTEINERYNKHIPKDNIGELLTIARD